MAKEPSHDLVIVFSYLSFNPFVGVRI